MTSRTGIVALTLLAAGLVWFVTLRKPATPSAVQAPSPEQETTLTGNRNGPKSGASPESAEVAPEPEPEPALPPAAPPPPKPIAIAAAEETPEATVSEGGFPEANLPAVTVLENMRAAVRLYQAQFRENPVGDNAEISRALTGENPKQAVFAQAEDGLKLNSLGQMIDNWGTPIFFHSLSRSEMEIRSAGPDRRMWTGDDLVLK
jgi:hypothetical protein